MIDFSSTVEGPILDREVEIACGKSILYDYRLASQPLKKYKKIHSYIPFKKRLIGTLDRMKTEGGHSPEVLNTIINLIKEGK